MLGLASDHAQAVWQNLLLVAYASAIAAIPMGDALLFSFTAKKPLAIGVARAVFVSSLGATLTMVITFAVWLTLESIYPQLHIDHFFYNLIEARLKDRCFYRILMIYILMEAVLMGSTAMVGGFLASITPFVGEQNQNKTKFTFSSLLMDLPLGLATISFVQVLTWCIIRYLDRFRPVSVSSGSLQDQQERVMMMMNNQSGSTFKPSRRVTFNTTEDTLIAPRCSDASRTSSTFPILEEQPRDDSHPITRMASSSSSTTLLPGQDSSRNSQSSSYKNKDPDNIAPSHKNFPQNIPAGPPVPAPILNSPALARTKVTRRPFGPHLKPGMYVMPSSNNTHISQPTPVAVKGGNLNNRFTSGALGRYAWMRNQHGGRRDGHSLTPEGPRSGAPPYSRSGIIGKANKPFGSSPYQRVSFKPNKDEDHDDRSSIDSNEFLSLENASNEQTLESHMSRTSYAHRKPVPIEAEIVKGERNVGQNEFLGNYYTDSEEGADSESEVDQWAETQSHLAHEEAPNKGRKGRFFGW
ncbi:hypothetical protein PSTG_07625 [Puccinia striiformis f. sp. tritici PST-78]|uniref:Uncharacterized protein n=1 Tax=Puccinia striiformis f. sp. tritici PST-78 TaxID=1165861 RepID=A0A0L0VIQ8_9BASI|nr:hypothetical protein PSTG_07625 [Puccinia striiformis f. sp. tritici PST-78]